MKCFDVPYRRQPTEPDRQACCSSAAFLMQRILASGQTHRRCQPYPICLNDLPPQADPPFTVTDVFLCAPPAWRQDGCPDRRGIMLQVTLPIALRLRDSQGCCYVLSASIEESLCLRPHEPLRECWRGQVSLQAAVRLASRCAACTECQCTVPMEVVINGYLLSPCSVRQPDSDCCFDRRPLYPQPICERGSIYR